MPALLGGTGIIGKDIFVKMKAQKSASIQTASGTVVTFPQSEERAFSGLNVYGHSTQSGTPSPENPVPIASAGDSGQINVNVGGKNLFNKNTVINGVWLTVDTGQEETSTEYWTCDYISVIPGNVFSITPKGSSRTWTYDKDKNAVRYLSYSGGGAGITLLEGEVFVRFSASNTISADTVMMSYGSYLNMGDYEPYKTPQTLTLSTPGGLPGIPVTSGGNYTDESGQQWICDEIDLARGKYVQRVGEVELDGTEAWELLQGIESGLPFFMLRNSINNGQSTMKGYSNYFPIVSITIRGKEQGIGGWEADLYLRWTELFSTVEDLKSFLSEKYTSGNPVRVYYILATPIETDLPAEEIAAYKALHTYSPTTTVSNDADAWMKVEYNEFNKRTF